MLDPPPLTLFGGGLYMYIFAFIKLVLNRLSDFVLQYYQRSWMGDCAMYDNST